MRVGGSCTDLMPFVSCREQGLETAAPKLRKAVTLAGIGDSS